MPSAGILGLEVEILADIFQIVNDASPRTTSAIAQVNKTFSFAVQLVRYRRETLHWDQDRSKFVDGFGRPLEQLLSPDRLRGLRHLTIAKSRAVEEFEDVTDSPATRLLIELLRASNNLKSLTYKTGNYPPSDLIRALQKKHPWADLKVYIDASKAPEPNETDPQDVCLAKSRLTELTMEIPASVRRPNHYQVQFEYMANAAKQLKSASLTMFNISAIRMRNWQAGSDGSTGSYGNTSLRHLSLDGWPLSGGTLEYWSQFVDLSRLETLSFTRGPLHTSYFTKAADMLRGLRSVNLNLSPFTCNEETADAAERYIATCSPLSTLSLWSWMGKVNLDTILTHHGSTLQDLQLHIREEEIIPEGPPQPLEVEKLRNIRMSCPKLSRFTVDVKRLSKDPVLDDYREIFDEIKLFNLEYLQIYFDSGLVYMVNLETRTDVDDDEEGDGDDSIGEDDDEDIDGLDVAQVAHEMPSPYGCGGLMDSNNLKTTDPTEHFPALHPPVSTEKISPFVHQTWKYVFGDRTMGDRVLDVKFGEWERKTPIGHYRFDGRPQKDLRVWCHAEPHPRDDKKGQSEVVLKCCQGHHLTKFSSG
ncbi:hypothetical protein PV08_09797 [Exophiala spinifera]|uniref:F-box domain-containing protein n=1 Tax=Exophiala spinifera TaxID=91928 RepID=A0A0D2B1N0_9EURO|nr:uncharacterized protein PV08_09797 [Exophiala spinifera]KIW12520.1 hypothetical protein PV08_09797 [Exophiala spinifera]